MLVKKTGGTQNGLEPELQCVERQQPGSQLGCDQRADRLELALGRWTPEGTSGEGAQTLVNRLRVQFARLEISIEHAVPWRRPALLVRAFDFDFPDPQARPLISLKHAVSLFDAGLHADERFELRFIGGLSR